MFQFDVRFKADGHGGCIRVGAPDADAAQKHVLDLSASNSYDLALHTELHPDDALKMHANVISNPHVPDSRVTPGRGFRTFELVSCAVVFPPQLADFKAALERYGFTVTPPAGTQAAST